MRCLRLVMSECFLSGRGQGHVSNFYSALRIFRRSKSSVYGWYTQLDRSRFVYDTLYTMEATRSRHGWVHMFITHRPSLTLQLHNFELFRICRRPTSIFCTVAWQLARFQLTRRIALSLGDSWAACCIFAHLRANSQWRHPRKKQTYSLVGSGLQAVLSHEILRSNDSRRLYDERPVGRSSYSRRESLERRLSCKETVCRPDPTPQVFQTDIESRQIHSQCRRPCQLSEVMNAKLS